MQSLTAKCNAALYEKILCILMNPSIFKQTRERERASESEKRTEP